MITIKEDRQKVQTRLDVNLVVEAGAGTGKTTLLIDRLCLALLVQGIEVEKLVALTFTEKAAAEIKTRLIFKLQALLRAVRDNTQDRTLSLLREHFLLKDNVLEERAEKALLYLDRAPIGTIHSFCSDILKAFPLEAGLIPNAEIDSGQKAANLFEDRWNSFLDKELVTDSPHREQWKKVLKEVSLDELKVFATKLCSGRIEDYSYYSHREKLTEICLEKAKTATQLSTLFLNGKGPRKIEKVLALVSKNLLRTVAFLRNEPVEQLSEEIDCTLSNKPPAGWDELEYQKACELVSFSLKVSPEKQQVFLAAYGLVKDLVAQIRTEYNQEGILSFDDLLVKTRNLLQNNLWVRRLLKEKFDVLFIDEFQDTDPVQGELLLFLAEEKSSSALIWQQVRLQQGKLFVVGDPKQSIYRFRGADISAYELFTNLILLQGGEKCFLQRNFRSEEKIVAFANAVCSSAMKQEEGFQPAYVPIFTDKKKSSSAVEWLFVNGEDSADVDDLRHNQGEMIAEWITTHVGNATLEDGSKLSYRDIALLTRANTTIGPYTEALRRHGIPFRIEEEKDFFHKQEISDFLNLLRLMDSPNDKIALAGVLRSPYGGYTDEELYQIKKRGELSLFAETAEKSLSDFYKQILQMAELCGRCPLDEFLENLIKDTFVCESCMTAYEGEQSLANIRRFVRFAKNYTEENPSSLGQFLSQTEKLKNDSEALQNIKLSEEAQDAVSVMTIHKSKGLEFPIVFWVDLSKPFRTSAYEEAGHLFSWHDNMCGWYVGKLCDINLAFLEEEEKKHLCCEEMRVLYVALTRAKEKLLLVADSRSAGLKAAAPFIAAGLFPDKDTSPRMLEGKDVTVPVTYRKHQEAATFRYRMANKQAPVQKVRVLSQWKKAYTERLENYQNSIALHKKIAPSEWALQDQVLTKEQQYGAQLGRIVHKSLEKILQQQGKDLATLVGQAAQEEGDSSRTQEALEIVQSFTESALFKEMASCKILACEMPFSYEENGTVHAGLIDVILEKPDGTIWIADYKTDQITSDQIESVKEKYRPQLEIYRRAAQKIFIGKEIKCSILFVRLFAASDL